MSAWDDCKAVLPPGGRLTVRERENGTVEAFAQDVTTHQSLGFAYAPTLDGALKGLRDHLFRPPDPHNAPRASGTGLEAPGQPETPTGATPRLSAAPDGPLTPESGT